jgi:hypothetical protein
MEPSWHDFTGLGPSVVDHLAFPENFWGIVHSTIAPWTQSRAERYPLCMG